MKLRNFARLSMLAASLAIAASAHAGSYTFSFLSNDYQVSGLFSTSDVLNVLGGLDITGITGSVTGAGGGAITSLDNNLPQALPFNNGSFQWDNTLFSAPAPLLDNGGVLFSTANSQWNIYSYSANDYRLFSYSPSIGEVQGTFTTAPVPEPETYAMLLAGLGFLGAAVKRRKANQA